MYPGKMTDNYWQILATNIKMNEVGHAFNTTCEDWKSFDLKVKTVFSCLVSVKWEVT